MIALTHAASPLRFLAFTIGRLRDVAGDGGGDGGPEPTSNPPPGCASPRSDGVVETSQRHRGGVNDIGRCLGVLSSVITTTTTSFTIE